MKPQPLNEKERENLIAYLDGELTGKAARQVEAKLATDPSVRREAESLRKAWELLDYLPKVQASAEFTTKTMDRLAVQKSAATKSWLRWKPWVWAGGWAAAMLFLSFVGYSSMVRFLTPPNANPPQLVQETKPLELHALDVSDDIDFLHRLANPDDMELFLKDNRM
ncbi:MAG: hypothetical protein KatS3mg105_3841 [Gemmatales bacterium]|nr:MAG: hypothetical protein KatS3mg105_3841 [Gemmatales bacterium]